MKRFKILNIILSEEDQLNYSTEVTLVCLLFGTIFSSLISTILFFTPNVLNLSFIKTLLYFLLAWLIQFFIVFIFTFIPIMGLAVLLRLLILLLIKSKLLPKFRLVILLLFGICYLIFAYFLLDKTVSSTNFSISSLLVIPYILTFCFYTLYRNIWNAKLI